MYPVNVDHHVPKNTGAAPQMSCSTMPAQFGSSSKAAWQFGTLSRQVVEKYQCVFLRERGEEVAFPLVRRDIDQRILRHRINGFEDRSHPLSLL